MQSLGRIRCADTVIHKAAFSPVKTDDLDIERLFAAFCRESLSFVQRSIEMMTIVPIVVCLVCSFLPLRSAMLQSSGGTYCSVCPPGRDGVNGRDGSPGRDGTPGRDGVHGICLGQREQDEKKQDEKKQDEKKQDEKKQDEKKQDEKIAQLRKEVSV